MTELFKLMNEGTRSMVCLCCTNINVVLYLDSQYHYIIIITLFKSAAHLSIMVSPFWSTIFVRSYVASFPTLPPFSPSFSSPIKNWSLRSSSKHHHFWQGLRGTRSKIKNFLSKLKIDTPRDRYCWLQTLIFFSPYCKFRSVHW